MLTMNSAQTMSGTCSWNIQINKIIKINHKAAKIKYKKNDKVSVKQKCLLKTMDLNPGQWCWRIY